MSKEKADQAVQKLQEDFKDFPTFILFCVGKEGGFALSGVDEEGDMQTNYARLAAQMTDTLMTNKDLYEFLGTVMEGVAERKRNIN